MRINPEEMMAMCSFGMGLGLSPVDFTRRKPPKPYGETKRHSTLNAKQSEERKKKNKKAKESRKKNRK